MSTFVELPFDFRLTPAMAKCHDEPVVHQCSWCGTLVARQRNPGRLGPCPVCGTRRWWSQEVPSVGPFVMRTHAGTPVELGAPGPTAVLVACSDTKLGRAAPAAVFYGGPLFRLRVAWAVASHGRIAGILSARHGFLEPSERVEPYDEALGEQTPRRRRAWAQRVLEQLLEHFPADTRLVVLAGSAYVEGWIEAMRRDGRRVEWRRHRGIGDERSALSAQLKQARELTDAVRSKARGAKL